MSSANLSSTYFLITAPSKIENHNLEMSTCFFCNHSADNLLLNKQIASLSCISDEGESKNFVVAFLSSFGS